MNNRLKVDFTTNQTVLANYLCYLAKQISCGYYQDRRFLLTKEPIPYGRAVNFPDLPYSQSFWEMFKNLTQNDYIRTFPKGISQSQKLLSDAKIATDPKIAAQKEKDWRAKEKSFFTFVNEFLPDYHLDKIAKITCLVSPFGTTGSFHFDALPNGKYHFLITNRQDLPISLIAETILTLYFHLDNPLVTLTTWEIRESIVDFLMAKTKLGVIFDHQFQPTVTQLPEVSTNVVSASEQYLAKIGFPISSTLGINNNAITINSVPITNSFTPSEKRILTGLISHKNRLLTYDNIATLFWGEEQSVEKFSLQSIAKIMEKIRKKIKNHGIYQELIYTVRGEGYVLYD